MLSSTRRLLSTLKNNNPLTQKPKKTTLSSKMHWFPRKLAAHFSPKPSAESYATTTLKSKLTLDSLKITRQGNAVAIATENLQLVSVSESKQQTERVYNLLYSGPAMKYSDRETPWTDDSIREFVNEQNFQWNTGEKFGAFAVFYRPDDQNCKLFLGTLNLQSIKAVTGHTLNHFIKMEYFVGSEEWHKRYGAQIVEAALAYVASVAHSTRKSLKTSIQVWASVHPQDTHTMNSFNQVFGESSGFITGKDNDTRILFQGSPRLFTLKKRLEDKSDKENPAPTVGYTLK